MEKVNSLAYRNTGTITAVKSFIVQALYAAFYTHFLQNDLS
jgi:hypothetical protein